MGSSLRRKLASLDRRLLLAASASVLVLVLAFKINWNNPWVKWLGFGQDEVKIAIPKIESTDGQIKDVDITLTLPEKALWNWLEILAIPLLLLFLGYRLQVAEQRRVAQQEKLEKERAEAQAKLEEERVAQQEKLEKERAEAQAKLEKERAEAQEKLEKDIAAENLRDEALQAYFDRMSELLIDKG